MSRICRLTPSPSPLTERRNLDALVSTKIVIMVVVLPVLLFSAGFRVDTRYDYLRAGIAPRVQALGNTGVISATGPEGTYYNPALLINADTNFLAGSTPLGFDQQQYFVFYRIPFFYRNALFSVGVVSHQASNIEVRTSKSDNPDSLMNASDTMLVMSMSRFLGPHTTFGMNVQLMMDSYSVAQSAACFSFGLHHEFIKECSAAAFFRVLDEGQYQGGGGVRLDVMDDVTLYSSYEGAMSEGFSQFVLHYGLEWHAAPDLFLQAGYDGVNTSLGLTERFGAVGFQVGYTNTQALGARYSVAVEIR